MIQLDQTADTFPVGLAGTPFEDVYRALRVVAATVWSVDPTVYRAGMAWGWYALHAPAMLVGFRDVVTAALISVVAPMVKDTQTDAELVEYLRQWRGYTPTFPKLQALYALFGADVDIQPISDPESQMVLPVDDTRLAFYIRIESIDFSRPLSLSEAREIAVRATPLGSRPYPYYALETHIACPVSPAPVGIYIWLENWEIARPPAPPQQLGEFILVDASTGAVVYSVEQLNEMVFAPTGYFTIEDTADVVYSVEQLNEMVFAPTGYFTIEDTADVVFVEQSPYPIVSHFHVDFDTVQTLADGAHIDTVLPYYASKLYIAGTVDRVGETVANFGLDVSNEGGYVRVTNNTGASVTLTRLTIQSMDATDAEVVEVVDGQDNHAYAFKWDAGTPYWWISYSGERHWTDTLGSWSEVPSVVLPTVSIPNTAYVYSGSSSSTAQLGAGAYFIGHKDNGAELAFDMQLAYAVYSMFASKTGSTEWYCNYFSATSQNGKLKIKNITSGQITVHRVQYATCSDSTATVVTVYDSSNVAYNAFKFTASGTDYYYVLDGTQTDWTDDLAGIGYSLTPATQTAWLNASGNTQSLPMVGAGVVYTYILYDENGHWLSTNNDYALMGYHATVDGPLLSLDGTGVYLIKDTTYGRMKITSNGAQMISIQRIEYTVS